MTANLLDTNAALFALSAPENLSPLSREAILEGPNLLSVVSYWEVMLKSMKGKLEVGDPRAWWTDALEQLAAAPLILRPEHIAAVYTLPPHHQDRFDRVLIAQAIAEDARLITSDREIAVYASSGLSTLT